MWSYSSRSTILSHAWPKRNHHEHKIIFTYFVWSYVHISAQTLLHHNITTWSWRHHDVHIIVNIKLPNGHNDWTCHMTRMVQQKATIVVCGSYRFWSCFTIFVTTSWGGCTVTVVNAYANTNADNNRDTCVTAAAPRCLSVIARRSVRRRNLYDLHLCRTTSTYQPSNITVFLRFASTGIISLTTFFLFF